MRDVIRRVSNATLAITAAIIATLGVCLATIMFQPVQPSAMYAFGVPGTND